MSDFRFLHAADVHLDSPLRGLDRYDGAPAERLRVATREAFTNLVDLALEEAVDLVVLAGDIYDGDQKDFGTALFLNRELRRLGDIPVVILQGNHDAASVITKSLRTPENVHVLASARPETKVYEDLSVAVHGQSFPEKSVKRDLTRNYPDPLEGLFNLGVLHTALEGADGHANYAPCRLSDLVAKGYGYWALGHVHQFSLRHEDPWVVFSGNTQGRHARETGPKGCCLVEVRSGRVTDVSFRELDVLRWARVAVDATGLDDAGALWTKVEAAIRREAEAAGGRLLALRLVIEGETSLHGPLHADGASALAEARNAADAAGAEVWLEKLRLKTSSPGARSELFEREDELGVLLRRLRDGEEEGEGAAPAELDTLLRGMNRVERKALNDEDAESERGPHADARTLLVERILKAEGRA